MTTLPQPTKQQLANIRYYRQAGAVKTLSAWYPFEACVTPTIRGEPIGAYYRDSYIWFEDDYFTIYFNRAGFREVFDHYLAREASEPGLIERLHAEWVERSYQPLASRSTERSPAGTSTATLLANFLAVSHAYQRAWNDAIFLDVFDVYGEELIRESLGSQPIEQLDALIIHPSPSPFQTERLNLLTLANQLVSRGITPASIDELRHRAPEVAAQLAEHANRFHWIQNDYKTVRRLEMPAFFDRLHALVTDDIHRSNEAALLATVGHDQPQLASLPPIAQARVHLTGLISLWRDERKALTQQINVWLADCSRALADTTGTDLEVIEHLRWTEVEPFVHGQRDCAEVARERMHGVLYGISNRTIHEWFGTEARAVADALNEQLTTSPLSGRTAFPGRVKGVARVIMGQDDFHKLSAGDILIAPNTRPEYLPIMRLAAAVVTEEGGLTSHAAIVARELSVPTIVGVQGIIGRIADGDVIEVDATKGTVRKVSQ